MKSTPLHSPLFFRAINPTRSICVSLFILLGFFPAAFLFAQTAPAAEGGMVVGVASDGKTSLYLEGAEVRIAGTNFMTTTTREGRFEFRDVPAGLARIAINYPGMSEATTTATVEPGHKATVNVQLNAEITQLAQFIVTDERGGISKASALQKAAEDSKLVAASGQFGELFNGNAAEYLKFLPGVGISYASNDARALSLRGLNPSLTNVTMDGNPLANASSGATERQFEFEGVAISNVETVELFKTLTSDKQATSTGGSVNLITKSAFDQKDNVVRYNAFFSVSGQRLDSINGVSASTGEKTALIRPNAELDVSTKVTENLGFNFGVREYQSMGVSQQGVYAYNYNPAQGGLPNDPAPTMWRIHSDYALSVRRSASGRLDWRVGPRTTLTAGGSWNWFSYGPFSYHDLTLLTGARPALATGQAPAYTVSTGSTASVGTAGSAQMDVTLRKKSGTTFTGAVKLKHEFQNGSKLDANVYGSRADIRYSDSTDDHYALTTAVISAVQVRLSNLGAVRPEFTATKNGAPIDFSNLAQFNATQFTTQARTAYDTRRGASADFTRPFRLGDAALALKAGVRDDVKVRSSEQIYRRNTVNPIVPAGPALQALVDPVWSADTAALGFPGRISWIDPVKAYGIYKNVPMQAYGSDASASFDEDITAGYVRLDYKPRPDLLLIGGVRRESVSAKNQNRLTNAYGRFSNRDNFGSFNLKYTPTKNQVFRAAIAQSMGLPNYGDLLPANTSITEPSAGAGSRGSITLTNPNIRPYEVLNYDLTYELYFKSAGSINVSLFRKDFKNYIVSGTQSLTPELASSLGVNPSSLSGTVTDYNVVSRFNVAEKGYYKGLELSYSRRLVFMPAPFDTLGLQVNGTWIHIDPITTNRALISNNAAQNAALLEQVRYSLDLRAVKQQYNMILNWRFKALTTLLTMNYAGRVLSSVSRSDVNYAGQPLAYFNSKQYIEPRKLLDLRMEYRWSQRVTPFVQLRDLLNAPVRVTENGRLLRQMTFLDPRIEFGIKGLW
ncbi:MAG: TonB-dependent receptor [Opitutaceae bacterium]|nr:TonB-dependent receptor [Opitutaceae bacterium]